ncbi:hypothetical protein [Caulobacter sp.]|uniref:hypothetical protein n=1 Tax=Caulobacter sp. TaxID=78 RepID=UPI001B204B23|nr:hypothetical protein [Caulobacter sp.]MBO9543245.1 hypothetical protein [Caulobacter sp.]
MGRRIGTFVLASALAVSGAAWAQASKSPLDASRLAGLVGVYAPGEADSTVVLTTQETGPLRTVRQTVRRHGPWVRIDTLDRDVTCTRYVHRPSGLTVDVGTGYFSMNRPTLVAETTDYRSVPTGRTLQVAGETCQEWDVYRGMEGGQPTYRRLGCVAADGMELSSHTVGRSGASLGQATTAISVSRSPVSPSEVQPPTSLDPIVWAPPTPARDGWEVVLSSDSGGVRTVRARGAWRYQETRRPDGARDISSNLASAGFQAQASIDREGVPITVSIMARPPVALDGERPLDRPRETVLGQTCAWYDSMPLVSDAFRHECRTADGVVLRMAEGGRGRSGATYVAITLIDKPPAVAQMMPPATLFDLAAWLP